MNGLQFDPIDTCQSCSAELGADPYSDRHARVLDTPKFRVDLRWCFNCGRVSLREKSSLYNRFKIWRSSLFYDFFPFRPAGHVSLDEMAARYVELPGAYQIYMDLLWHIRKCLVRRSGGEPERSNPAEEAAAWALAKQKLTAFHLVEYVKMVANVVGKETAIMWLRGVEKDHSRDLEPHQRDHIRSIRAMFEKTDSGLPMETEGV